VAFLFFFGSGAYIVLYCILSARGQYISDAWRPVVTKSGEIVMVDLCPRQWWPFVLYNDNGALTVGHVVFYPLIKIDQQSFHKEQWIRESGKQLLRDKCCCEIADITALDALAHLPK